MWGLFLLVTLASAGGVQIDKNFSLLNFGESIVEKDPFVKEIKEAPTHLVHIQIINRKGKVKKKTLSRLIKATENIFSQCEGVRLKVVEVEKVRKGKSRDQENFVEFIDGKMVFSENFFFVLFRNFRASKNRGYRCPFG